MLFAYNHPALGATSGANGWMAMWVAPIWGPQAEKAQGIMALTDVAIKNAKPRAKPYKLGDAGGLFLLVQPSGGKLWRMKYRVDGREKKLGIGIYPDVSLADARKRRDDARELVAAGKDPSREKQRSKIRARTQAENTFTAIAAEAGVLHLGTSCAAFGESHGVRVNTVCPGVTETAILEKTGGGTRPDWLAPILEAIDLLTPADIARAILNLIEDDSKAGQHVVVSNPLKAEA
jgi:hypothetical protein